MIYISYLQVKNFKSLRNTEINLLPGLNILIGSNGSGKTNFLESVVAGLDFENFKKLPVKFSIKADFTQDSKQYSYSYEQGLKLPKDTPFQLKQIDATNDEQIIVPANSLFLQYLRFNTPSSIAFTQYSNTTLYTDTNNKIKINYDENDAFYNAIMNINFYNKDYKVGAELKSMLKITDFLNENLKQYSPIEKIDFEHELITETHSDTEVHLKNIKLKFFLKSDQKWYNWEDLSDGTRRIFYLIVYILCSKNAVFLLEEPELGIHPHQLHELMVFIKSQAKNKQIILTTHSPQVLECLTSNELDRINIVEMTENGTKFRKMSEKQCKKAIKYMQDSYLSLGDYWVHSNLEKSNEL